MGENTVCGAVLKQTQETHGQHPFPSPTPVCCKLFCSTPPPPAAQNFSHRHAHFPLQQHRIKDKSNFSLCEKYHTCARVSHAKYIYGKGHNFSPSQLGNWGTSKKNNRGLKRVFAFLVFFLGNLRDRGGTFFPPPRQRLVRAI